MTRLRFVTYVLLVVLAPVALAGWIFLGPADRRELREADAPLKATIHAAADDFGRSVNQVELRAMRLASSPVVRHALAEQDRRKLARITHRHPQVAILSRHGAPVAGRVDRPSVRRTVDVMSGRRTLGSVVAAVPLDEKLARRLAQDGSAFIVAFSRGSRIEAASKKVGGRVGLDPLHPEDVRLGGSPYRAIATPLTTGPERVDLVVLRSMDAIQKRIRETRRTILLALGGVIGGIALIAYALAPAISRGRTTLAERAQAAVVLSHVADGIFLTDGDGVVLSWNPAAEAITGLGADLVRGKRLDEVVAGWSEVLPNIPISSDAAGRSSPQMVPLTIGRRELWLSISGIRFSEGIVFAFRDMTEEQRVNEWKSDFVATVSHELRTPLSSIFGAAMTLREKDRALGDARRDELLRMISDQSDRLAGISDQILLASRLSSGTLPVQAESFDADDLARGAVESQRPRLPKGLTMELISPIALPRVYGDRDRTSQVLLNLLDNAIKYSPDGGRLEIRLEPTGKFINFSVSDQGLGIPHSEQERIFDKFHRLDPRMARGVGGTGLGLYICRELVRRMNGHIWVSSEPGMGSTFSFVLPAVAADGETSIDGTVGGTLTSRA